MANCLDIWASIKPDSVKDEYDQCAIDALIDGFEYFPFYEAVYRNLNLTTQYHTWITDGNKYDKQFGYKKIVSYPYTPILFEIGDYITFNYGNEVNSNWLIESLDTQRIYDVNGRVLKCSNSLKWIDDNGEIKSYPCSIKDTLNGGREENRSIVTFSGDITVFVQINEDTEKLDRNKRFLFSNAGTSTNTQVYSYELVNIENFLEGKLMKLHMSSSQKNEDLDDIPNRIAEAYGTVYTVDINQSDFEQTVGYTSQLTAVVKLNNDIVAKNITWSTSNSAIGTIDTNGNINLLSVGAVVFTATMTDNTTITDSITVTSTATPTGIKEVRILPNVTEIFQADSQTYNVLKFEDNAVQADTFVFTTSGANSNSYTMTTIDGNNFKVDGLFYDATDLTVTCTSNTDATVGIINIKLKGLF